MYDHTLDRFFATRIIKNKPVELSLSSQKEGRIGAFLTHFDYKGGRGAERVYQVYLAFQEKASEATEVLVTNDGLAQEDEAIPGIQHPEEDIKDPFEAPPPPPEISPPRLPPPVTFRVPGTIEKITNKRPHQSSVSSPQKNRLSKKLNSMASSATNIPLDDDGEPIFPTVEELLASQVEAAKTAGRFVDLSDDSEVPIKAEKHREKVTLSHPIKTKDNHQKPIKAEDVDEKSIKTENSDEKNQIKIEQIKPDAPKTPPPITASFSSSSTSDSNDPVSLATSFESADLPAPSQKQEVDEGIQKVHYVPKYRLPTRESPQKTRSRTKATASLPEQEPSGSR